MLLSDIVLSQSSSSQEQFCINKKVKHLPISLFLGNRTNISICQVFFKEIQLKSTWSGMIWEENRKKYLTYKVHLSPYTFNVSWKHYSQNYIKQSFLSFNFEHLTFMKKTHTYYSSYFSKPSCWLKTSTLWSMKAADAKSKSSSKVDMMRSIEVLGRDHSSFTPSPISLTGMLPTLKQAVWEQWHFNVLNVTQNDEVPGC